MNLSQRKSALFGSGGNPKAFYDEGSTKTPDMMKWLAEKNLDSYEYQGGQGLTLGKTAIKAIRDAAEEYNIMLSVHAPYFIAPASMDEKIRGESVTRIVRGVKITEEMGAYIFVVHPGGVAKSGRDGAFRLAYETISKAIEEVYKAGAKYAESVCIGLETMGKENQLGTLEEIIELCKIDDILYPVVDFGHLYARSLGNEFLKREDFQRVFDEIGGKLSDDKAKYLHCHFSKIEYTPKGEKKHLTFANDKFGPEFNPLGEVLAINNLCPNIICESDDTMADDALMMKKLYLKHKK